MFRFQWYTNGVSNLKIIEGDNIPENFYPGFTQKKRKKIENKLANKLSRLEKRVALDLELKHLDRRVHDMVWKSPPSLDDVYEKLKFADYSNEFILNKCLRLLIIEKSLIYQLETMPVFYRTTFDSLQSLYNANPRLQRRRTTEQYILDELKNDVEAVSTFYGDEFLAFLSLIEA